MVLSIPASYTATARNHRFTVPIHRAGGLTDVKLNEVHNIQLAAFGSHSVYAYFPNLRPTDQEYSGVRLTRDEAATFLNKVVFPAVKRCTADGHVGYLPNNSSVEKDLGVGKGGIGTQGYPVIQCCIRTFTKAMERIIQAAVDRIAAANGRARRVDRKIACFRGLFFVTTVAGRKREVTTPYPAELKGELKDNLSYVDWDMLLCWKQDPWLLKVMVDYGIEFYPPNNSMTMDDINDSVKGHHTLAWVVPEVKEVVT
jgi:hypothetical protein